MIHPSEEELLAWLDGHFDGSAAIDDHVAGCARCSNEAATLRRILERVQQAEVPDPGPGFEERIWARQRAELERSGLLAGNGEDLSGAPAADPVGEARVVRFPSAGTRRLLVAVGIAASIAVAFVLGLYTPPPGAGAPSSLDNPAERMLLVALGAHLERTRMVLVELDNLDPGEVAAVAVQRQRAAGLVADNRLYRQSAALAGRSEYAGLLDEIERVLLELGRDTGRSLAPAELEWLRDRVRSRDLLFRIRVLQVNAPGLLPGEPTTSPSTV